VSIEVRRAARDMGGTCTNTVRVTPHDRATATVLETEDQFLPEDVIR
jgi:hypothetical protein